VTILFAVCNLVSGPSTCTTCELYMYHSYMKTEKSVLIHNSMQSFMNVALHKHETGCIYFIIVGRNMSLKYFSKWNTLRKPLTIYNNILNFFLSKFTVS
jgi:hypothetical protein